MPSQNSSSAAQLFSYTLSAANICTSCSRRYAAASLTTPDFKGMIPCCSRAAACATSFLSSFLNDLHRLFETTNHACTNLLLRQSLSSSRSDSWNRTRVCYSSRLQVTHCWIMSSAGKQTISIDGGCLCGN